MKKQILILIILLVSILGIKSQNISPNYVDGLLYVKLVDNYPLNFEVDIKNGRTVSSTEFSFLKELFNRYGVTHIAQEFYLFEDIKLLHTLSFWFTEMDKADEFIADLLQFKEIEYAEKPTIKKRLFTPNDPYYGIVDNENMKWHLDMIKASYAWDLQVSSPSIKVAIVDDAIWGAHEDLQISANNLCYFKRVNGVPTATTGSANPPSSVNQNITCTNNTFYSNCPAYDWSHGTHCAGLAGAINNNGKGVASIGSGVTLMGVRMSDDNGNMYYYNNAVQWAAANGAKVISMSYGSPEQDNTERQILQTAYNRGIILVAAAGNEGEESDYQNYPANYISYPAGYNTVISVASVNSNKKLSSFSQYGTGRADIAAPGGYTVYNNQEYLPNILSTTFCKTQYLRLSGFTTFSNVYYDGMQGTSMACPIVAGLCGLLASAYPSITPAETKQCLQSTAQPLATGSRPIDGNGIINAYSAVLCVQELAGNVGICKPLPINNQISIFPNPSHDCVQVSCTEGELKTIEIYDIAGRKVYENFLPENETTISISHLTNALYLIKIVFNDNETVYKKLIKQQ